MPQECKGQKKVIHLEMSTLKKWNLSKKGNHLSLRNPQKMLKVIP